MSRRPALSTLAITALAVVDAVLIALLIVRHPAVPVGDAVPSGAAGDAVPSGAADAGDPTRTAGNGQASATTASPEPTRVQAPQAATPQRGEWVVDALSPTAAVRARTGDCPGGKATLQVTSDRGRTWEKVSTPATSVLRVKFVDEASMWFVGTGGDCDADFFSSGDGGSSWEQRGSTGGAWHRMAGGKPGELHGPGGKVATPCDKEAPVVALSGVTTSLGYVLCADGGLHRSNDGGSEWRQRTRLAGAWAVSFTTARTGYAAVRGRESCAGVAVLRTTDAGKHWNFAGCVTGLPETASIAMSFTKDGAGVMVAEGSSVWTRDRGKTWEAAS